MFWSILINFFELLNINKAYIKSCPPSHFLMIHFKPILPCMPESSKWFLSLTSAHQNSICTSTVCTTWHMSYPPHSSWFDHLIIFDEGMNYKACYIVISTPLLPCPSETQISSSASNSWTPSASVPPSVWETSFTPIQNKWKNYSSV